MKNAAIKKMALVATMFIAMVATSATADIYQAGDFQQHSLYTNGSVPFMQVMEENAEFGLDWWANSKHGGAKNSTER